MTFMPDYMLDPPAEGYRCGCRSCRSDPFVCSGVRRVEAGRNIFVSGGKPCGCGCHSEWWDDSFDAAGIEEDAESPFLIDIPPSPSDRLRAQISEADWSIFDHDDTRSIGPRSEVYRLALIALAGAVLASIAVFGFVR